MSERLTALAEAGVSIWLDDLSRERIETAVGETACHQDTAHRYSGWSV